MLYFSGPKNAECSPIKISTMNNRVILPRHSPTTPSSMKPISQALMTLISQVFSSRSASRPAVAEHSRNGRMNKPAARLARMAPFIPACGARRNTIRITIAVLNRLSLSAPRN